MATVEPPNITNTLLPHTAQYLRDLANLTTSGPHPIGEEQRNFNKEVHSQCSDILPFDDVHKLSDCDLIYKFGIARKWDVEATVKNLHEYIEFRHEHGLNEVLWQPLPEEALVLVSQYHGFDTYGCPVMYDKPDPKVISKLLLSLSREILMQTHFMVMEQGRRWQLVHGADRVSCVLDLQLCGASLVSNTKAMGWLKEMSKLDQHYYPENMRTMCIYNGGWSFSGIWAVVRPFLDVRVQKKIQVTKDAKAMAPWVPLKNVPSARIPFGAAGAEGQLVEDFELSEPGTLPRTINGVSLERGPNLAAAAVAAEALSSSAAPPQLEEKTAAPVPELPLGSPQHRTTLLGLEQERERGTVAEQDDGDDDYHSLASTDDEEVDDASGENGNLSASYNATRYKATLISPEDSSAPGVAAEGAVVSIGGGGGGLGGRRQGAPEPLHSSILLDSSLSSSNNAAALATTAGLSPGRRALIQKPLVSPPTILSESLPKRNGTLDMVLRSVKNKRIEAYVDEGAKLLCYAQGSSIFCGQRDVQLAQLVVESGHPIHTYLIVLDGGEQPRFILKKRSLHKEIQIFVPKSGASISRKSGGKMQALYDGERVHVFNCTRRKGSCDQRDWQVRLTVRKDKDTPLQVVKVGDTLRFQDALVNPKVFEGTSSPLAPSSPASSATARVAGRGGAEPTVEPHILFALAAAINELWYFS